MANSNNNGSKPAQSKGSEDLAKASVNRQSQNKGKSQGKKKGGLIAYLRGVRQEFKKVVWPTREELVTDTVVVFACVISALPPVGSDCRLVVQCSAFHDSKTAVCCQAAFAAAGKKILASLTRKTPSFIMIGRISCPAGPAGACDTRYTGARPLFSWRRPCCINRNNPSSPPCCWRRPC